MPVRLLDVNVLLALAWPNHVFHGAAHAWFGKRERDGWATCPLTQAGFVRLSCMPRVVKNDVALADALKIMEANTASRWHHFWPDQLALCDAVAPFRERIVGHQQVADAYLLGLAISKKCRLATFDKGIASLLPPDSLHATTIEIISL